MQLSYLTGFFLCLWARYPLSVYFAPLHGGGLPPETNGFDQMVHNVVYYINLEPYLPSALCLTLSYLHDETETERDLFHGDMCKSLSLNIH